MTGSPVFVPDNLVGLTPEQAQSAIELADLTYQDGGPVDSDLPTGVVASTSPGGGAKVPRGTVIVVYTSNGQGAVVPDVVSDNQSYGSAESELNDAGFSNVEQTCSLAGSGDPPGTIDKVTAQSVAAGSVVNKNTDIVLSVRKTACP
jgi:beta-lactam-binding protein with PASTA domain